MMQNDATLRCTYRTFICVGVTMPWLLQAIQCQSVYTPDVYSVIGSTKSSTNNQLPIVPACGLSDIDWTLILQNLSDSPITIRVGRVKTYASCDVGRVYKQQDDWFKLSLLS